MNKYTLRPGKMTDLEAVVDFCNLWEEAHSDIRSFNAERMHTNWTTDGFDMAHSTRLVLTPEDEIVGYASVWDIADPPVKPYTLFCVHPDRPGEGISTLLLDWAEDRSRECLERVPPDVRVTMEAGTLNTFELRQQRLNRAGFQLIRHYFHMQTNLDTSPSLPHWPEGITVSHYDSMADVMVDLREILTAFNESFRDHYGHVERSIDEAVKIWAHRLQNDSDFDPTLWFVARDGNEIAGMSLCWPRSWEDPDEGYISILGVRRPWRRRGLGLALLRHAFCEFYRRGTPKAGLGVDAGSLTRAVALYEKAGMSVVHQYDSYEKELRPGRDITTQMVD